MSDPATIRFYDEVAGSLAELTAEGSPEPALARFIASLAPGSTVIDLGCGAGLATAHLCRAGYRVTGLDASAELLKVARRLAPDARFLHAGFEALTQIGPADAVWANFALVHAPRLEMPALLAAIADALPPDGILHLSMLIGEGEVRDHLDRAYTYYSPEGLRCLTAAAGFTEIAAETGTRSGATGEPLPYISLLLENAA